MAKATFLRVPYPEALERTTTILGNLGMEPQAAAQLAEIFAVNSLEGVPSHGLHMFPSMVGKIRSGRVDPAARAGAVGSAGAWERWEGHQAPGPLAALDATRRTMVLAREHGLGAVALAGTNHWSRPAYFGYEAARQGFPFLCWTNTPPVLPAWGTRSPGIGNNPLVLAFPREPWPVVLDIAMSQFSMGRLRTTALQGDQLPVPGGFDAEGKLSTDPEAVHRARRSLPIGFWKGSGLALMLDLFAAALSGGRHTAAIADLPHADEPAQLFLAFDPSRFLSAEQMTRLADEVIAHLRAAEPDPETGPFRFPGEGAEQRRAENLREGIPVEEACWQKIVAWSEGCEPA